MDENLKDTVIFYGVYTFDDEQHGSFKAYCSTRKLAEEELKHHSDWYNDHPEPDDKHIIPLEMIVENSERHEGGMPFINRFTLGFGHHD